MLKNKFILVLLIFSMLYTYTDAQPEPFKEPPKKVKMPRYFTPDLSSKSKLLSFSAIHVLQTVWDSTTLGYIQKGMFSITTEAIPAKAMTAFLQEYVTAQYKDYFKKDGKKVLMVFKDLRVTEKTFFAKERGYLRFIADAYISQDGLNYKRAVSVDTVFIMQGMGDITLTHGENLALSIQDLLKACLRNCAQILNNEEPSLTVQQIKQNEMRRSDWPIIKAETISEGA